MYKMQTKIGACVKMGSGRKHKESKLQRAERIRLGKTLRTQVIPNKKKQEKKKQTRKKINE